MAKVKTFAVPLLPLSSAASHKPSAIRESSLGLPPLDPMPQTCAKTRFKSHFPERLWAEAILGGQSQEAFWMHGARFSDDGQLVFYCAEILGPRLALKPGTIAHNIRGYLGFERPRRMTKEQFEGQFGSFMAYRGQVWIVSIPGLNSRTNDFHQFRWLRPCRECNFHEAASELAMNFCDCQTVAGDRGVEGECLPAENGLFSMIELDGFELNREPSLEHDSALGAHSDFDPLDFLDDSRC
jgi:hypothetical protein